MNTGSSAIFGELAAVALYFAVFIFVAISSHKRMTTSADFIIGNRSMNFWLTAMAAHASDMSSWLFMGYPAMVYLLGPYQSWAGIGLILFMYLNWQYIAPKVRTATEQYNSLTFSSFFENRLGDQSGRIRVFTAIILCVFYTIYISAALMGTGLLLNVLFGLDYHLAVTVAILIIIPYLFIGGYLTLAWIDLFQGLFLLCVIVFVPLYVLPNVGGFQGIGDALKEHHLSPSLFKNFGTIASFNTLFQVIGWGLGYFGQPHIITKFMGIRNISEISKSKLIGMTWMILVLSAATLIGLIGIPFFGHSLPVPSQVFISMVYETFSPFLVGLILCAVFAATINAVSSMVLVLSSSLAEDLYKKLHPQASPYLLLKISKLSVILVSLLAFAIAFVKADTIYGLVLYAWSGLGAAFGPLLLFCLYVKSITKHGAWSGILVGGLVSALWPLANAHLPIDVPPLPPAFILSCLCIWAISKGTQKKSAISHTA